MVGSLSGHGRGRVDGFDLYVCGTPTWSWPDRVGEVLGRRGPCIDAHSPRASHTPSSGPPHQRLHDGRTARWARKPLHSVPWSVTVSGGCWYMEELEVPPCTADTDGSNRSGPAPTFHARPLTNARWEDHPSCLQGRASPCDHARRSRRSRGRPPCGQVGSRGPRSPTFILILHAPRMPGVVGLALRHA